MGAAQRLGAAYHALQGNGSAWQIGQREQHFESFRHGSAALCEQLDNARLDELLQHVMSPWGQVGINRPVQLWAARIGRAKCRQHVDHIEPASLEPLLHEPRRLIEIEAARIHPESPEVGLKYVGLDLEGSGNEDE